MISRRLTSLQRLALLYRQRLAVQRFPSAMFSSTVSVHSRPEHPSLRFLSNPVSSAASSQRYFHTSNYWCGEVVEVAGPEFAESISEGDIRWMKQKGDYVTEDELVAEIETDKTSLEVPAQYSGTIVELLVPEGGKVVAKQKLYKIELGEAPPAGAEKKAPEEKAAEAAKKKPSATPPPTAPTPTPPPISTAPPPPPSRPLEGAIPKAVPHVAEPPKAPMISRPVSEIPVTSPQTPTMSGPVPGERSETRVKMNRMRLRIAQRMKDAQNTYAMLTTFNEVDMSNVVEMRARYQKAFVAKHGIKLGLMSPFIKAAAFALQQRPVVNAVIDEGEIVYRHYIDMSIAVATPKGLVVPVLRNVDQMDYAAIEKTLSELGTKAREGKLAIEDMEGGTFTISNGGVFGSMFGTPIINPPQSAILGMHGIFDRPVAVNGKVEIRPMMTVALTYDHRLIDGRDAVSFLKQIKSAVEDPRVMLMNL
ncbi:unnamed protein product [Enterobius vermicularis]|uniref:Dihydrolipoyllysine-residue succinyltransferase component of 2-oxoglutarate dehydrogenase complex, mitochondrial n=1 Tax=Enterobius vermicularis TaxID=51028 RepID=A0A0N4V3K2_ENTVE|nr:unnamed protein product [Enterobius vermicularis]